MEGLGCCVPEVVGPVLLTKATSGNQADPRFLQQLHAVKQIRQLAVILPEEGSGSVIQVKRGRQNPHSGLQLKHNMHTLLCSLDCN